MRWERVSSPFQVALFATPSRLVSRGCLNQGLALRGARSRGFGSTTRVSKNNAQDSTARQSGASTVADPVSEALRKALSEVAFAFDIDGVLYQGHRAVPGAGEMLRKLKSHDIRYLFLTNGGGRHEAAKAESLSRRLGLAMDEGVIQDRVIQSHTPMSGWDEMLKQHETILITGAHPDTARKVAMDYGFKKVITPADIMAANGKVYPFASLKDSLHSGFRALPDGKVVSNSTDPHGKNIPKETLKVDHIFVWNDPRDWSLDIQVMYDLLISHQGYYGTISDKNGDATLPNNGWQQDGQPSVWVSNIDLFWKTEYPVNRYGTGAFLEALKGVWSASTGGAGLQYRALGKPFKGTYDYAHDRLLHHDPSHPVPDSGGSGKRRRLRRVYMIGDNPESDIRGANEYEAADGTEWVSILVETGVWRRTVGEREPRWKPATIVEDVVEAVAWAMQNEGVPATRDWLMRALREKSEA